ncbi:hypothetical protein B0T20DRAFT_397664 [Sordaria brevicollis]|uniref:Uncharacterized protein n=1 Tax=Sordaria brevicollis TaxID=83679 RepID=A0AAE0U2Y2_SORBR|nr:hypothetical protein B0T20DRAFT_397664 [Sordaria brevicollis]
MSSTAVELMNGEHMWREKNGSQLVVIWYRIIGGMLNDNARNVGRSDGMRCPRTHSSPGLVRYSGGSYRRLMYNDVKTPDIPRFPQGEALTTAVWKRRRYHQVQSGLWTLITPDATQHKPLPRPANVVAVSPHASTRGEQGWEVGRRKAYAVRSQNVKPSRHRQAAVQELEPVQKEEKAILLDLGLEDMSLTNSRECHASHAQTSTHVDSSGLPIRQRGAKIVAFQRTVLTIPAPPAFPIASKTDLAHH